MYKIFCIILYLKFFKIFFLYIYISILSLIRDRLNLPLGVSSDSNGMTEAPASKNKHNPVVETAPDVQVNKLYSYCVNHKLKIESEA